MLTHLAMLADEPRVAAYRAAIERHAPGRFVLELGTGSGVLSIFAARAGARRVLAVEESAIAGLAAELFAANAPTIELAVRSSRDLVLPDDQRAEVIVHELLGADPLAEGLLPTIADARRRLLAPGGRLLPSRLELYATGVALTEAPVDRAVAQTQTTAIAARHALDLAPLSRALAALPDRAYQHTVRGASFELLTEPTLLHDLDLTTVDEDACAATLTRTLTATRAGTLSAVLLHFRAHLDHDLVLSNGPELPETHWGRRITALSHSRPVHPGDRLPLQVTREATLHHERLRLDWG
ncbi:MAG TPA: 50S ribosomal protein L11 methyltransferase, partial [Gemmatimonadales bacterium]|nr:50S ribosomal protein L11 methyltransferase [Gemmatimonadales bacterium]